MILVIICIMKELTKQIVTVPHGALEIDWTRRIITASHKIVVSIVYVILVKLQFNMNT